MLQRLSQWLRQLQAAVKTTRQGGLVPATDRLAALGQELSQWEAQRAERQHQRSERRQARRQADRSYFGEELMTARPAQRAAVTNPERLAAAGLPLLADEASLAAWLGLELTRLRWFTHDQPADRVWHYRRSTIPKRSGGERVILAPRPQLKALQRHILRELLSRLTPAPPAHGFRADHSIVTNAQPHVGHAYVLNLDLADFFPSITFARVRGLLIGLGYSFAVASTLALLCTEYDREPFDRDDGRYYVSVGPRHLVQGAPTSPALANLIAGRLDRRLAGLAARHDFAYTRYADDLTFSGASKEAALRLLAAAPRIIAAEGFRVNPAKTRLYPRAARQVVTGLVVNTAVAVPRRQRRQLRAILHNAQRTGLAAQNRAQRPDFRAYLAGLIGFIGHVHPGQAAPLRAALQRLIRSAD